MISRVNTVSTAIVSILDWMKIVLLRKVAEATAISAGSITGENGKRDKKTVHFRLLIPTIARLRFPFCFHKGNARSLGVLEFLMAE